MIYFDMFPLNFIFSNLKGYKTTWLRSDFMAALVVTAIAIPESLGYAIIVGLPVQAGLYCALLAPIIFAAFTSSKRLIIGADSATAALVASGAATLAVAGTPAYANAVLMLGLLTGTFLIGMSVARFGFMADLISQPVLVGFISGIGIQLMVGKLPDMVGISASGTLFNKLFVLLMHFSQINLWTTLLSVCVVAIIILGWKFRWPGALIALLVAIAATKLFNLHLLGINVIGSIPEGIPSFHLPHFAPSMVVSLYPAAFSIAIVILAQSLAVIRNSAIRHEEKVKENQDLMALGIANITSAFIGGFAVNGSPPRTTASELAGGHSQLVNIIMAALIGLVLVFASGLFKYVPVASLAAIVFTIGLHLMKIREIKKIWSMRKSEFIIAMIALCGVAVLGVQQGVIIAVVLSLIERLRRQYHPHDEVLLRDQVYTDWAKERLYRKKHHLEAPSGALVYRFNDAIFFENATYFFTRFNSKVKHAKKPVKYIVLDGSAISDIDYTGAQMLARLATQFNADDIQFTIAHVSTHLRKLLVRYGLVNLIGTENIFPSVRSAIDSYCKKHINNLDRIKALHLSSHEYVVIGGAVLEFLGLRQTTDVDLVVSQKVYDQLLHSKTDKWKEYVHDNGKHILSRSGYKIMTQWMGKKIHDLQKSAFLVNDIPLMGLKDLIECKAQLGRKKDLEDIEIINSSTNLKKNENFYPTSPALAPAKYIPHK